VLYRPAGKRFRELGEARMDGSLGKLLPTLARVDVLVVDDFSFEKTLRVNS
jgi:DNA replication protein DnaC